MRASAATTSSVQLDSPRLMMSATALSKICSRRFSGRMRCARFLTGMDFEGLRSDVANSDSTPVSLPDAGEALAFGDQLLEQRGNLEPRAAGGGAVFLEFL